MPEYPVRVPRDFSYRGIDASKRERLRGKNELAARLEEYINRTFQEKAGDYHQFIYQQMALDLDVPAEDVREILFSLEGGHNGFGVWTAEYAEARRKLEEDSKG